VRILSNFLLRRRVSFSISFFNDKKTSQLIFTIDGAGIFYGDAWAYQCPPQGMTAASFKDATWQALGRETGEGLWSQISIADAEGIEGDVVKALVPSERGWFACSTMGDVDSTGILIWGGLNGKNEREDSGWILRID
jgi:hypothetical protein